MRTQCSGADETVKSGAIVLDEDALAHLAELLHTVTTANPAGGLWAGRGIDFRDFLSEENIKAMIPDLLHCTTAGSNPTSRSLYSNPTPHPAPPPHPSSSHAPVRRACAGAKIGGDTEAKLKCGMPMDDPQFSLGMPGDINMDPTVPDVSAPILPGVGAILTGVNDAMLPGVSGAILTGLESGIDTTGMDASKCAPGALDGISNADTSDATSKAMVVAGPIISATPEYTVTGLKLDDPTKILEAHEQLLPGRDGENLNMAVDRRSSTGTGRPTDPLTGLITPLDTKNGKATAGSGGTPELKLTPEGVSPELTYKQTQEVLKQIGKDVKSLTGVVTNGQKDHTERLAEAAAERAKIAKETKEHADMLAKEADDKRDEIAKQAKELAFKLAKEAEDKRIEVAKAQKELAVKHAKEAEVRAAAEQAEHDKTRNEARESAAINLKEVRKAQDEARKVQDEVRKMQDEVRIKVRNLEDELIDAKGEKNDLIGELRGHETALALLKVQNEAIEEGLASVEAKMAVKEKIANTTKKMTVVDTLMQTLGQKIQDLVGEGAFTGATLAI